MDYEWLDIQVFHMEDADEYNAGPSEVELPFEIKAQDFMLAARRHQREGSEHKGVLLLDNRVYLVDNKVHLVDALANAKRALDCRLQELLFVFGLDRKARHWPVPKKLDVLEYLDLPAPKILRKVNIFRNVAEHDFVPPNADAVADFVDAVFLFLECTRWYIKGFADEVTYYVSDCDCFYWRMHFDRNLSQFTIHCYKTEDDSEDSSGTLDLQDHRYLPYLRAYLGLLFDHPRGSRWHPEASDNIQL